VTWISHRRRRELVAAQQDAFMDDSIKKLIEALQDRRIYRTLDASTLAAIADDKVELAIVDYVHTKLEDRFVDEAAILASLRPGVRALYLTWGVEIELIHGGFSRYYRSTAGHFAQQAAEAFDFFGAHQHAGILREANRIRAEEKANGEPKNEPRVESFFEPYRMSRMHWLDDHFYKLGESLSALRVAKIRAEPELFLDNTSS
jgi:hypothetical protein